MVRLYMPFGAPTGILPTVSFAPDFYFFKRHLKSGFMKEFSARVSFYGKAIPCSLHIRRENKEIR